MRYIYIYVIRWLKVNVIELETRWAENVSCTLSRAYKIVSKNVKGEP
jgi:hypothetical protein